MLHDFAYFFQSLPLFHKCFIVFIIIVLLSVAVNFIWYYFNIPIRIIAAVVLLLAALPFSIFRIQKPYRWLLLKAFKLRWKKANY